MTRRDRRWFMKVAGGSSVLAWWLRQGIERAEGAPAPLRMVVVSRPNGTIDENWLVGNNQRGRILEPFAGVWPHTVALKGVDVKVEVVADGDPHSKGSITIMTGAPRNPKRISGNDNHWNTAISFDQVLAKQSPVLSGRPVQSLQLGGWSFGPGGDAPSRALSFAGAEQPLYPETQPLETYKRLFMQGALPGGGGGSSGEPDLTLTRLRQGRKSVLDFVKGDLSRVRAQAPSAAGAELDAHEAAVRDLEKSLETLVPVSNGGGGTTSGCAAPSMPGTFSADNARNDANTLAKIGQAHFAIVRAAFVCDLTRVVTFMWCGGAAENVFTSFGNSDHHRYSHGNKRDILTSIDRWYSEQTAPFVQSLIDTPDPAGGKLIDGTLVWYISEVAEGWNHRLTNMPFLLFGGDRVGLKNRGRVLESSGHTANDVWLSLAPTFGTTLPKPATPHKGAISGLIG